MEYYDWDKSKSKESLISLYSWPNTSSGTSHECIPHATEYRIAVTDLISKEENEWLIDKYKQAVKNVLNLQINEGT